MKARDYWEYHVVVSCRYSAGSAYPALAVPGCILSDLERWLRQIEVPGWSRDMSLARTVSGTVIGYHPPDALFTVVGVLLFSLAVYAFVRYHLRDVITLLRRGNR